MSGDMPGEILAGGERSTEGAVRLRELLRSERALATGDLRLLAADSWEDARFPTSLRRRQRFRLQDSGAAHDAAERVVALVAGVFVDPAIGSRPRVLAAVGTDVCRVVDREGFAEVALAFASGSRGAAVAVGSS